MAAVVPIAGVFLGCCSQVVFLEHLIKYDQGAGHLITFCQFAFIALEGFVFTAKFGLAKRIVSLRDYALLVVMFFMTSICNNYAFTYNIPMPLHMIFRGGSLISNMIMGSIILRRRYRSKQYLSALMISTGIFLCTYYSTSNESRVNEINQSSNYEMFLGVILLALTLLVSSYMGITQELMYKKHGAQAREALYYTHLLPLPGFAFLYKDINAHFNQAAVSPAVDLPILKLLGLSEGVPIAIVYLVGNVLAQYLCISSVYKLTSTSTSLTVTLILTLRKFVSLLFSIVYFQNPFTIFHWLGTFLVFMGTLMFSDVWNKSIFNSKRTVKRD